MISYYIDIHKIIFRRERERVCVCVCVIEREREREREREKRGGGGRKVREEEKNKCLPVPIFFNQIDNKGQNVLRERHGKNYNPLDSLKNSLEIILIKGRKKWAHFLSICWKHMEAKYRVYLMLVF